MSNEDETKNQQEQAPQSDKPTRKSIPVWAATVGMAVTLVLGGGIGYGAFAIHNAQQATTTTAVPAEMNKVVKAYATISQNYYQSTSSQKLINGAISGMVNSLKDPYSVYLQNQDATSLNTEISGSFGGIGATMEQRSSGVFVESVNADSAAKKAGVQAGDQIVSVDGKSVTKQSLNKIVAKVRGKIGTKVTVGVKRGGHTMTFTMKRAKVTVASITGKLDSTNKQVGIITFTTFTDNSGKEMKKVVKKLRQEDAKKFVLDLRGNPGGVLDQALAIDSMFLKNGQTILKVKSRTGAAEVYKAGKKYDDGFKITEPTVVLIDGDSASAAEITAAALNEQANVPLLGQKSFGKGTVQTVADMGGGNELKLTIAKWLTPNGTWINHKGIQPTEKVDNPSYANIPAITVTSMKEGDANKSVKSLQRALNALGYDAGTANGYYSSTVTAAVKAFQSKEGLTATGEANEDTISELVTKVSAKISDNDTVMKAALTKVEGMQ